MKADGTAPQANGLPQWLSSATAGWAVSSLDPLAAVLARAPLFDGLGPGSLRRLALLARPRRFAAGDSLFREDDPVDGLWVIITGRVRIDLARRRPGAPLPVAERGPGEVVGELGPFDERHTMSATALEETEALRLSHTALALVTMQCPVAARRLPRNLDRQLRSTRSLIERAAHAGRD